MSFKRNAAVVVLCLAAVAVGCVVYDKWFSADDAQLHLYGSIDMRTVNLAFEESGRLVEVNFDEGAAVQAGDVMARLDDERYKIALDNALAAQAVANKELDLLLAGSRKEDIDAAKANLRAAQASETLAVKTCERERRLGHATTKQRIETACFEAQAAAASRDAAQKQLDLLKAGTRQEQIDIARAQVQLAQTVAAQAQKALSDTVLKAPVAGVVRCRMKHKGDMTGPSAAVYELAMMQPLWVRAWVDEVNLGKLSAGKKVEVTVDSYPGKTFEGTVGFISTVAEFTPKTVQTEDLRTSLVYEVRVILQDHENLLRLGMPATVTVSR